MFRPLFLLAGFVAASPATAVCFTHEVWPGHVTVHCSDGRVGQVDRVGGHWSGLVGRDLVDVDENQAGYAGIVGGRHRFGSRLNWGDLFSRTEKPALSRPQEAEIDAPARRQETMTRAQRIDALNGRSVAPVTGKNGVIYNRYTGEIYYQRPRMEPTYDLVENPEKPGDFIMTGFMGYPCTQDCSGHRAGYDWAERRGIEDVDDCGGDSRSFIEGCFAYVEQLQAEGFLEDCDESQDECDE